MFVLFGLADFQRLLVQQVLMSYMMLELLHDVVEDGLQSVLALLALVYYTGVHVRVIVDALNVRQVATFLGLSEYNRNDLPSSIVLGICRVLVFIQRRQHFICIDYVNIDLGRVKRLSTLLVVQKRLFDHVFLTKVKQFDILVPFHL